MMEATAPTKPAFSRIRCIDWLRGLAVFDMIMWHTACLLREGNDKTTLGILAGLVAPSFMFAAGFAIALVMVRASGDPAARRRRALKSLQRIAEVLAIAIFLKWMLRSGERHWLLKIDILSCIAYSLLLAWPVMVLGARWPKVTSGICLALALVCFGSAPLIPGDWWGDLALPGTSDFAPIPWFGYVFLGAAVGGLGSLGLTGTALMGLFTLGMVFRFVPWHLLYGNAWVIANAGERFMMFGGAALALYAIEREATERGWKLDWPPFSFLELVGTNAMTAYVAHIWLLYVTTPVVGFSYVRYWRGRASWAGYWALLPSLWAVTMAICWGWPKLSKAVGERLPWKKAA